MNTSETSSVDPGGPRFHLDLDIAKIGIGGAIVADLLQILAAVLQLANEATVLLYVASLLAGAFFIVLVAQRPSADGSKRAILNSKPIAIFAVGTLVALIILALPTVRALAAERTIDAPTFYIRVLVYGDSNHDGEMDGLERPIGNIPVTARDRYGMSSSHPTGPDGVAMIPLPTNGNVSIGVCSVFQTHSLTGDSNTREKALQITIGIDPSHVDECRS